MSQLCRERDRDADVIVVEIVVVGWPTAVAHKLRRLHRPLSIWLILQSVFVGEAIKATDAPRPTEPNAPLTLAQALPAKLTEVQAGQALDPVLRQIGQTSGPDALRTLAQALQALAAKLTDAQAVLASKAAAASLAWAADDEEAAEWARALVTLSRPAANRDGMLVNAIAYPAAAGSATEVLLDAIRAPRTTVSARLKAGARTIRVFSLQVGLPPQAQPATQPEPAKKSSPTLSLPDKPSIAVLPFQNMSDDPSQDYFVDGMVEDIITGLSLCAAKWTACLTSLCSPCSVPLASIHSGVASRASGPRSMSPRTTSPWRSPRSCRGSTKVTSK